MDLQDILHSSYETNGEARDTLQKHGYTLDDALSNREAKVFVNPEGQSGIVFRGSKTAKDFFISDPLLAMGLSGLDQRQKNSNTLVEAVRQKYKTAPNLYGHSLGGNLAENAGKANNNQSKVITYNKITPPLEIFRRNPSNQTDIRTTGDIVSSLGKLQTGNKQEIHFDKGIIRNHKIHQLRRLPLK